MLKDVIAHEPHLFTSEEMNCFLLYATLSSNAKYLFIRLCLRKSDQWLRLDDLRYQDELGDNIASSLDELCRAAGRLKECLVKQEEQEIIDLDRTFDPTDCKAGPSSVKIEDTEGVDDLSVFVVDHNSASLVELLECLRQTELREVAKDFKIKTQQNRNLLISQILTKASKQTTIETFFRPICKHKGSRPIESGQLHSSETPQERRLREVIMKILRKCVRINSSVFSLFRRVNLVYFRCTQHTPNLLTASILAFARKRFYPAYEHTRTSDIWATRDALLAYERALEYAAKLDALLEGHTSSIARARSTFSQTPALTITSNSNAEEGSPMKRTGGMHQGSEMGFADGGKDRLSPREQAAKEVVKLVFDDGLYSEWQTLIAVKGEEGARSNGRDRFHHGYILTRLVAKGFEALHVLKEYERELEVLQALLSQRRWRRGRRGSWYDQRALILMEKFDKDDAEAMYYAMDAVVEALEDPDVHLMYRPKLQRRLQRLEKCLRIPLPERHTCEGVLQKHTEIFVEGERVRNRTTGMHLDATGSIAFAAPEMPGKQSQLSFVVTKSPHMQRKGRAATPAKEKVPVEVKLMLCLCRSFADFFPLGGIQQKGKSIWVGKDREQVNVETLALEDYQNRGYKGYHSEGRIVRTLFGLLFWDVLFAPIPGAFETPYQSAPLDIADDTFFFTRQELIKARLSEIEEGKAREILEAVDDQHREKKTWCVGVQWDIFERQDLIEIIDCFEGRSLAIICRLFCEEYARRCSGLPDLLIWNHERRECKFVEVKGPGDSLQENQKLWIDVLLRANVPVEVCRVVERGQTPTRSAKRGRPRKLRTPRVVNSDTETEYAPESEEDELNESQYDMSDVLTVGFTRTHLTRVGAKRALEEVDDDDTLPGPSDVKRARTSPLTLTSPSSSQTSSRMKVEVVIKTPSPKKRKSEDP
ncbi:hypothetical protein EW146_g4437 [Bondarzewia mesenterica]|uniref:Fanconi-associated nuclease n=1 Tax=Bondarzewia mesenterica TaxID=1095465 RepID=A0A4S4LUP7_9AGAM|nr:hypothetical protein EW146_g4437 [Bondarzewia mesenterica]